MTTYNYRFDKSNKNTKSATFFKQGGSDGLFLRFFQQLPPFRDILKSVFQSLLQITARTFSHFFLESEGVR